MQLLKTISQYLVLLTVLFLGPFTAAARDATPRILVMGDSLLATHSLTGNAVSDYIEKSLGQRVNDRSTKGARIIYKLPITGAMGLNIGKQYRKGQWDWIVLNGGGNDIWFGCGCHKCERRIRRLISADGKRGEVPKLVSKLRRTGAKVIYIGYLRSPGVGSMIESCKDEGDLFESRVNKMAKLNNGVYFLSLADLVPYGDRSYHAIDMVHPSIKASKTIGGMVVKLIAGKRK